MSNEKNYPFIDRYVDLVKSGMRPEDAKKQAELEIYGVDVPQPRIVKKKRKILSRSRAVQGHNLVKATLEPWNGKQSLESTLGSKSAK